MAKEIRVNNEITLVCRTHKSRSGFRHIAEFYRKGVLINSRSVSYQNRTWESFKYETVIDRLLDKMRKQRQITSSQAEMVKDVASGKAKEELDSMFGSVSSAMAFGDALHSESKAKKNKFKLRMLKASFGDSLMLPSDWSSLSETEKEKRLAGIEEHLRRERD